MKRILALVLCALMVAAVMAGCGEKVVSSGTTETTKAAETTAVDAKVDTGSKDYSQVLEGSITDLSQVPAQNLDAADAEYQNAAPKAGDVVAILHTTEGDISMRFFPEVAPMAVNNFIALAKAGKYDNNLFHRVINNFMIQCGDYTNFNGTGGESIYGKTFGYEISDYALNVRGAVAMAHTPQPDSNGSQFYINQVNNNSLDGQYTVFGQVYDGMDVVDKIAAVKTDANDKPLEDVKLTSIEIKTYE